MRNVDDTIVITKYDKIKTLDVLNKFNCKVQFTYESATYNTLPFLDCFMEIDNEGRLQAKSEAQKLFVALKSH